MFRFDSNRGYLRVLYFKHIIGSTDSHIRGLSSSVVSIRSVSAAIQRRQTRSLSSCGECGQILDHFLCGHILYFNQNNYELSQHFLQIQLLMDLLTNLTDNYDHSFSNPFFNCWIISMIVSSCYTYVWDIKMDWGLFDPKSPSRDYPFLREEIVYSSQNYYYFAIIEDLILRFGWTLSVSLSEVGILHADIVVSILAPLELFR